MDRPDASRRLFVAIMVDDAAQAALLKHRQQWTWPHSAKLADAATLHTTLHYFGEIAPALEASLLRALRDVPMTAFDMRLGAGTVWGGGIAVLLVDHDDALTRLHAAIDQVVKGLGLRPDKRSWTPHLTLAKRAQGALPPPKAADIKWRADRFSLVWSRPAPSHGYVPIATWQGRP